MLIVLALAGIGCLLGAVDPPHTVTPNLKSEVGDLARVACTTALAISLLLGPGILWRALGRRRIGLAYVPLPGLALLVAAAILAWVLSSSLDPKTLFFAVFAPLLGFLLGGLLAAGPENIFEPEEQRALVLCGLALGLAVGRTIWTFEPDGGLYAGGISRTFYPEPRPDSRIPYLVSELIAHGKGPYSPEASALYSPYTFSSRGPLGGLATAPIVFLSGGKPPIESPEFGWQPFDEQGFMAFRLAMITFSLTALLSLWELVRRIGGLGAARFAVLLGATTPFIFDELLFTWPKLLAASFVLLGGLAMVERRPLRSGLTVGVGYLMHPSALLALSGIGLLALWPQPRRPRWLRPDLKAALLLLVGVAVSLIVWRLASGSHYDQNSFLEYFREAEADPHASLGTWIGFRLGSLGNTLVPLMLPIFYAGNHSINVFGGSSPTVVHVLFQYWSGVPFGLAIVFFPLLLVSLWRAARLWPWAVVAVVLVPLLFFAVYWGSNVTGLLREGMQWWVLTLIAVVALQQTNAGFPWLRSTPIRVILCLRVLEVLVAVLGMAIGTKGLDLISAQRPLNDLVAMALVLTSALGLALAVWRARADRLGAEA